MPAGIGFKSLQVFFLWHKTLGYSVIVNLIFIFSRFIKTIVQLFHIMFSTISQAIFAPKVLIVL